MLLFVTINNTYTSKKKMSKFMCCRCFSWSRACSGPRHLFSIGCHVKKKTSRYNPGIWSDSQPSSMLVFSLATTGLVINLWSTLSTTVWVFQIELHPSRQGTVVRTQGWEKGMSEVCVGCFFFRSVWWLKTYGKCSVSTIKIWVLLRTSVWDCCYRRSKKIWWYHHGIL